MRRTLIPLLAVAALAACGGGSTTNTRAEIEDAIDRHLARRSDLDIDSMKVTVGKIDLQGEDQAQAIVAFQVGDNPASSMQMVYDLKREGGVWEVQRREGGMGASPHGGQAMPPAVSPGSDAELPPDHPPIGTKSQTKQELPAGHPPVQKE